MTTTEAPIKPPAVPETPRKRVWLEKLKEIGFWNLLLWLLMRLAFVAPTIEEIKKRQYPQLKRALPAHTIAETEARFLFDLAEAASDHTDDKTKQLLTLGSSLVAVLALFGGSVHPRILVGIVAFALLVSILMCVMALGVRRSSVPDVSDPGRTENADTWARDLLEATYENRSFHGFRVDQYRCATRYFVAALVATGFLALMISTGETTADLGKTHKGIEDNGIIVRPPPPPLPVLPPPWKYP